MGHAGEGPLLDQGSPASLRGSAWARRVAAASMVAGRQPPKERKHVMEVGGVGKGAMRTQTALCHEIAFAIVGGTAEDATYDAPVVESETILGLLGLKTGHRLKVLVDTDTYRMIVPGPGGVNKTVFPRHSCLSGIPDSFGTHDDPMH